MISLLNGVRVIDMTALLGAVTTTKLADLGADVIRIEQPPYGDYMRGIPPILPKEGVGLNYVMLNRNKRSLGIDLGSDEGRRILFKLIATADVVVENARPGVWDARGLGYESLRAVKPDIIYASVSGFGQSGPYKGLPSHGLNIDAAAGMFEMSRGPSGRPEIVSSSGVGVELGPLHGALVIVAALLQRNMTGEGKYIDASMWDAAVAYNSAFRQALNFQEGEPGRDAFPRSGGRGARMNTYGTKDDKVLFIVPIEKKFWIRFCAAIGREDWVDRGTWELPVDFGEDDPSLRDDIEEVMRTRTADEWMEVLLAADVPVTPVLLPADLESNAHVQERGMIAYSTDPRYSEVKFVRAPTRVSGDEFEIEIPPPTFGEHTKSILTELGYPEDQQEQLAAEGVIVNTEANG